MKNVKSTIAMRLAHKIHKQFPNLSFKFALKYGWKLVHKNQKIATKIANSDKYIIEGAKAYIPLVGWTIGIEFKAKNILRRLTHKTISVTLWDNFRKQA